MRLLLLLFPLTAGAAPPAAAPPAAAPPPSATRAPRAVERAVVRLQNTSQRSDWRRPWNPGQPARSSGSGFVMAGGRILTNAHVVADSKNLVFHLHGDAKPHDARIVVIGHDCDLAIVEPVEKGILDGITPLQFGEMPAMGADVTTFGYPAGGRWLSSTSGVVSRIDYTASAHAGASHLSVQTDAAINPGNSGGPVLGGGKVVGVAYQAIGGLENVGFFIPPPIIQHFLTDAADGTGYEGFPQLDINVSNLDAPAARRRAGMAEGETGVRIDFVQPGTPAQGVLQMGDILLHLGGEKVENDGTFAYMDQMLQLGAVLDRYKVGDKVKARVLRGGERLDLDVPVVASVLPLRAYEKLPTYLCYAGLVFVPLDREYLETQGGGAATEVLYDYAFRQLEFPDRKLPGRVVLLRRLDHQVNATFPLAAGGLVEKVNGQEVHTLQDLAAALSAQQGPHHVFEFAYGGRIGVLDRAEADAANAGILKSYGVGKDRRL
jgi:S1-C subfamily serine protease